MDFDRLHSTKWGTLGIKRIDAIIGSHTDDDPIDAEADIIIQFLL